MTSFRSFRSSATRVRAFEIPCIEQAGYEADDLIATYARIACEAGATATIVSSDKDLMQLVNDCVIMYDTMKDVRIGVPEVIEKFGVPPAKVIEVQALIGDSTGQRAGRPGHRREDGGAAHQRTMATSKRCSSAQARSSRTSAAKRSWTTLKQRAFPKSSSRSTTGCRLRCRSRASACANRTTGP